MIENLAPKKESQTKVNELESNWTESADSFDQLDLKSELLRGIYGMK